MGIIGIVQVAKQYLTARHHFKLCDNLGFGTILVDRELRLRGGVLVTPLTIQCRSLSSNLSVSSTLLRGTGIFFPSVKSCHTPNHIRISSQWSRGRSKKEPSTPPRSAPLPKGATTIVWILSHRRQDGYVLALPDRCPCHLLGNSLGSRPKKPGLQHVWGYPGRPGQLAAYLWWQLAHCRILLQWGKQRHGRGGWIRLNTRENVIAQNQLPTTQYHWQKHAWWGSST